ncbi:MFS transporter [Cecembia sp.]|uniref:MFS transporter n=1 Tax=Cecembia sp. TaxID=1898110 RepID=UPI0025C02E47|nr:MFS transporter [Cecembia sp.]
MKSKVLTIPQILLRFRVATYLYWALSGAFLCYYILFFEEIRGIKASDIGLMMSLYTLSALIGQNVFGFFSDKLKSNKIPIGLGVVFLGISFSLFPFQENIQLIYANMMAIGFLQQPIGPMIDAWALRHLSVHNEEKLYGKIRGLGSFGWSSAAIITAYLIQNFGWNMMYWVAVFCTLLLFVVVMVTPDCQIDGKHTSDKALTLKTAIKALFGNPSYVYILLVIFFLYLGVQTAYNYMGLIIKETGGGVVALGWTYFVDAGSEIPAMFLSVWLLSKYAPRKLMISAVILYILRFAIILYFQTPIVVTFASILEGFAFGLMLTALRKYIFDIITPEVQTTALTISDAVFLSLSVMIGGAVGGWIIQEYSTMTLLSVCMGSAIIALSLLLLGRRFDLQSETKI